MITHKKYWFPAKSYGWGWDLPSAWQGWVVFGLFLIFTIGLPFLVNPVHHFALYLVLTIFSVVLFLLVCWLKGEPPQWRWGDHNKV